MYPSLIGKEETSFMSLLWLLILGVSCFYLGVLLFSETLSRSIKFGSKILPGSINFDSQLYIFSLFSIQLSFPYFVSSSVTVFLFYFTPLLFFKLKHFIFLFHRSNYPITLRLFSDKKPFRSFLNKKYLNSPSSGISFDKNCSTNSIPHYEFYCQLCDKAKTT